MMDSNKRRFKVTFNAPVILGFTIVCFIVLILDQVTVKASTNLLFSVYRSSLLSPFTYIRFFGHVLGHHADTRCRAIAGREIRIFQSIVCDFDDSAGDRRDSFHIISGSTAVGGKRRCVCPDFAVFPYLD